MPVELADPVKMVQLAEIIEGEDLDSSMDSFIRSLALPVEEEGAIIGSLAQLPHHGGGQGTFPRKAPDLVRMAFWG